MMPEAVAQQDHRGRFTPGSDIEGLKGPTDLRLDAHEVEGVAG
jgi:hypothetical protein